MQVERRKENEIKKEKLREGRKVSIWETVGIRDFREILELAQLCPEHSEVCLNHSWAHLQGYKDTVPGTFPWVCTLVIN